MKKRIIVIWVILSVIVGLIIEWRISRITEIPECKTAISRIILNDEVGFYRVEELFKIERVETVKEYCERQGMGVCGYASSEAIFAYSNGKLGFPTVKSDEVWVFHIDSPTKAAAFITDTSLKKFGILPDVGSSYVYHYGMSGHWIRRLVVDIMKKFS
jgi:hypothetical protein